MIGRWLARYQPEWLERVRLGAPHCIGPTGETALFLDGRWNGRNIFVQVIAKIDEAGTHDGSPFMILGGYMAKLHQWNRFDHRWKKALRKARLPYFHVKEHGWHPFALKAVRIADENLMLGFVVRLAKSDYDHHYRHDNGWGGKVQPDSMYGLCFRYCLSVVLRAALAETDDQKLTLNFVVGDGHPNCGAAAEIIRTLKKKNIIGVSEYLGNAVAEDAEKTPGLQAADGVTSGAWQLESQGLSTPNLSPLIDPAHSLKLWEPARTGWKVPVLRCELDARELQGFKGDYFAHFEHRRQWGQRKTSPSSSGQSS